MTRPRMSRDQIAKLAVGQEVKIACKVYGATGKVVKVTPDSVDVLTDRATDDQMRHALSTMTPKEQRAYIARNMGKLFRFDKDGHETNESVNDRGLGPDPTCGPWDLEQDETVQ